VTEAGDGQEGLEMALATPFNMIVTDLDMPDADALTMIRDLRKEPTLGDVPIIFLTTESDEAMKREAQEAGATGWLVKPFAADQLVRITRKALGR